MRKFMYMLAGLLLACAPSQGGPADAQALPATLRVEPQQRDFYNWQQRHEAVTQANAQTHPEYVILGDSITHFWAGDPPTPPQNRVKLNRAPEAWNQVFGGHKVVNMGFGFDYIDNAYYRIQDGELADATPRVIIVLLGTNNIGHRKDDAEACAANMKALLKLLRRKAPQSKILLVGILPRREAELAPVITKANTLYKKLADNKHIFFVNPSKHLAADPSNPAIAAPAFFSDVVHPNQKGYEALAPVLSRALRKIDPEYHAPGGR